MNARIRNLSPPSLAMSATLMLKTFVRLFRKFLTRLPGILIPMQIYCNFYNWTMDKSHD